LPAEALYQPPSPPSDKALAFETAKIAVEAKLAPPFEVSDTRKTYLGPGAYYVCVRGANPPADVRTAYYSVFFNNEKYVGGHISAIAEQCETQNYRPLASLVPPEPPPPAPDPKPLKKKKKRPRSVG
jgi:hypothetical protein